MQISDITRNFYQNPLLYAKNYCPAYNLGYKSLKTCMNYNFILTQQLLQLKRQKQSCQKIKDKFFPISRSNSLKLLSQQAFSVCDKSKQSQNTCGSDIEKQQSSSNFSETKYPEIYLAKQNNYDQETPLLITQSIIPHYKSKSIAIPRENKKIRNFENLKFPKIEFFQENSSSLVENKNQRLKTKQNSISQIVNAKRQPYQSNIYNSIQLIPKQQTSESGMKKVYLMNGRENQLKQWHSYYIKCSKTVQISSWDNTQQDAYAKQVTEEKEQNLLDIQTFEEYVQNLKQK